MKWDALEEEPCSLARTIGVIGDRWTLLICGSAFCAPGGSRDFSRHSELPGICLPNG